MARAAGCLQDAGRPFSGARGDASPGPVRAPPGPAKARSPPTTCEPSGAFSLAWRGVVTTVRAGSTTHAPSARTPWYDEGGTLPRRGTGWVGRLSQRRVLR